MMVQKNMNATMTEELIQEILYSEVKNATHLSSRRIHYLGLLLRSGVKWMSYLIFGGNTERPGKKRYLLSFLSKHKIDAPELWERYDVIFRNDKRYKYFSRHLIAVEIRLLMAFLMGSPDFKRRLLVRCQERMQALLQRYEFTGFLCGHPDLLTRFVGVVFHNQGKHVVTMQHGIYQLSSYKVLWFEKALATKILVWGEAFKELYARQGVPEQALVVGAPNLSFVPDRSVEAGEPSEIKPVIIGQPFYKYHARGKEMYNRWITEMIVFFKAKGVTLTYRPHPRESVKSSLTSDNLKRVALDASNRRVFMERYSVFYSITSTLLIEVFLNRKRAVQFDIDIDGKVYDRYAEYMQMPTITLDQLDTHLASLKDYNFAYQEGYLNLVKDHHSYNVSVLVEALETPAGGVQKAELPK